MVLTAKEEFVSWYSAFTMAHSVVGIDLDDLNDDFLLMYNSVIETVWQSMYPSLTAEEIEEIKEDINIELMKARTVLEEAVNTNKVGDRV